jgi:hypothetical protein
VSQTESSRYGTEHGETKVADHGLIGDLRTAALVSTGGTIDWLCVPVGCTNENVGLTRKDISANLSHRGSLVPLPPGPARS